MFLYDLLLFGIIWDRSSGKMRQVPDTVAWHFYFELHRTAIGDVTYRHAYSESNLLKLLPVLYHASQRERTVVNIADGGEFDIEDPDFRYCLQVFKLHCAFLDSEPWWILPS